MLNIFQGSWRTSVFGILSQIAVVTDQVKLWFDEIPTTNPNLTIIGGAVLAAWAFWKARDDQVSSERAGAK